MTNDLPMDMGRPERQTHNYIRHGTVDLFAALNVATGQVVAHTKKQHRSRDFVSFLREIDERVDPTLTVHVILDNLSAHKSPLVKRWVARHPRFQFHFTPTYSAWLNLVERFFGLLTEHALKRGSHSSTHALRHAISAYVDAHNDEGKPFKWTKTADEILAKVKRFGQRTVQGFRRGRIRTATTEYHSRLVKANASGVDSAHTFDNTPDRDEGYHGGPR